MTTPLTPTVRIQTQAPFPVVRKDEETGVVTFTSKADEKVVIQSSAELMHYDIPGSKYQSSSNFVLLHDADGQPVVLSIGTDSVCLILMPSYGVDANVAINSVCTSVYTSTGEPGAGRPSILLRALTLRLLFVMRVTAPTIRRSW